MTPFDCQTCLILGADIALIGSMLYAVATLCYRVTNEAVEVLILGWCVRRIRLDDIEHVRRGGAFWNEHWTNFKLWNSVTLRRKSGWFRNFVITPNNPTEFIVELAQKLENLK
ncbi:MAG: hypothetical protein NT105_15200 [Verrucomicrobia bacterium]|nr:hypothetical protein [Verrucomicrobiota bacterium]